jgi:hypothetical protein
MPPARWVGKPVEDKRIVETSRPVQDDKWAALKAYQRSKAMCFICGEKWGKDNQCKASIQLHVVQEMLDCIQDRDSVSQAGTEGGLVQDQHLMMMSSVAALNSGSHTK